MRFPWSTTGAPTGGDRADDGDAPPWLEEVVQARVVYPFAARAVAGASPAGAGDTDAVLEVAVREALAEWHLTPREADVLRCVVLGDTGKEVASTLCMHPGSVERHMTSLLRKSGCESRGRLIARFWMAARSPTASPHDGAPGVTVGAARTARAARARAAKG